ncbi:hypothetical protein Tsubulata_030121 [Turnera subulata]|uniref:Protein kinase domain-containing protein n=1 Tax=Turnera subulata TaxID=218843 RepID=A0A9Q0JFB4_9ROSI|nr:hypothetical protein Tsubulata_030121 [Turnera subulata]
MEEEATSWIRRTKFSHTVCHRLDSKLALYPLCIPEGNSGLKTRPEMIASYQDSLSFPTQKTSSSYQKSPRTPYSKQRSLSPIPQTNLPDTFKEARSSKKRFSTPHPRRKEREREMGVAEKLVNRGTAARESKQSDSAASNASPLQHFSKGHDKSKSKKDSAWTRYFDHGGGKVSAVGAADEFTVDMSQLFLGVRFAHGAHSRLYHGFYKDEPVAVKIITVPDDDENGDLAVKLSNQYEREVTFLSRLHHPNVIKFVAACRKPPVYLLITEYLSEGSLRAYLHKLEHKLLPLQKLVEMALDIAHGMEYIHSQGLIHRDLKPENVLIDEDFHLKIADFGIACREAYCDSLADDPGTFRWMAPEMIKKGSYGRKADVYSFGLILWELVAGRIPYEDLTPFQAAFAVAHKNLRPIIPKNCPTAMSALIEQCWAWQPEKRLEFWQIVKVLEEFSSSLARDGTLNLVQNPICQDHKKGFLHWIHKLGPVHPSSTPMPKPKFS